jgi:hypothetical protein
MQVLGSRLFLVLMRQLDPEGRYRKLLVVIQALRCIIDIRVAQYANHSPWLVYLT